MKTVFDAATEPEAPVEGRRARRLQGRLRRRRRLAAAMAAAGIGAVALAVLGPFGSELDAGPGRSGSQAGTEDVDVKPPSTGPGGVGTDPKKTGLPAVSPEGGKVRTGTEDEGCFADMRSYLEQWHNTGIEPEPCFTEQPASAQEQPKDVQRSYNGERF